MLDFTQTTTPMYEEPKPMYRVLIVRDSYPRLYVFITNKNTEIFLGGKKFLSPVTVLQEMDLDFGIPEHISLLLKFDEQFCNNSIRILLQQLVLIGINFEKRRPKDDQLKDIEET